MASTPPLQIVVNADTAQAEAGLDRVAQKTSVLERTTEQSSRRTGAFSGALTRLGNVSNQTRAKIQLASFQIQDIAVQMQSGTRASVALSQQLPQLAGAFGAAGAALGVGLAVGIPLAAHAMSALQGETVDNTEALENLTNAVEAYTSAADLAEMSAADLSKQFGSQADGIRETLDLLRELALSEALSDLTTLARGLSEEFQDMFGTAGLSGRNLRPVLQRLTDELRLSAAELDTLTAKLDDLGNADGPDEIIAKTRELNAFLLETFGTVDNIPPRLRDMAQRLADADVEASALVGTMEQVGDATSNVANEAARAARNLATMASINAQFAAQDAVGGGRGGDPRDFMGESPGTGMTYEDVMRQIEESARGGGRRSSRGGGRGGTSQADQAAREAERIREAMATRLEALRESLLTEREAVEEWRTENLELLQEGLENELITQADANERKLRLEEEYQERLQQIREIGAQSALATTLGSASEILTAMGQFNDKALRIAKVAAAAEALVSTYKGQAKALELPFPQNLAAAAIVGAKGLAFVSAIKNVSKGGGGGGAGSAAAVGGAAAPSLPVQTVQVNFAGSEAFRNMGQELVGALNQAQRDGYRLNLVAG